LTEELAWGCAGICGGLTISNIPAIGLLLAGTEEQKRKFLGERIEARQLIAYALSEPGAGSDVKNIRTRAEKVGDEYSISGTKCFITIGDVAAYDLVFAVTDPTLGHRGLTAFFLPSDREGIRIGPPEKKMGQHAAHIVTLSFDEVRAARHEVIGSEGSGFKLAMEVFNRSRPTISATAIGVARRAMEMARAYANGRQTMGQAIIEHQAIGFMLADMDIMIAAARHLTLEAAWLADQGLDNRVAAARAKCLAADTAMKATTDAVQIFGGYGYMREYGVEKLMRDAKVTQIYEGTTQIQRLIIARAMAQGA
jgi:acyl-CoA dehydrogenase